MLSLISPGDVLRRVSARAKGVRLAQDLTQAGLAARSGVSLGSLKRFERTGEISLRSLVQIAFALGAEKDFLDLFPAPAFKSLSDVIGDKNKPRRGRRN